jgi:hypothetical protein
MMVTMMTMLMILVLIVGLITVLLVVMMVLLMLMWRRRMHLHAVGSLLNCFLARVPILLASRLPYHLHLHSPPPLPLPPHKLLHYSHPHGGSA